MIAFWEECIQNAFSAKTKNQDSPRTPEQILEFPNPKWWEITFFFWGKSTISGIWEIHRAILDMFRLRKPTLGMQASGFRFLWKYLESISAEHQSRKDEIPKPHFSGPLDEVRDQADYVSSLSLLVSKPGVSLKSPVVFRFALPVAG